MSYFLIIKLEKNDMLKDKNQIFKRIFHSQAKYFKHIKFGMLCE